MKNGSDCMRNPPEQPEIPVPDPTAVGERELAKSGNTRRRILKAARDLLATSGYAGFATGAVAEGAGLTRPAMLYHFGSRQELLTATIHYLARRRIELFTDAMKTAIARHGDDRAAVRLEAVDIAFEQVRLPEHLAFQELITASRTDPGLAAAIAPAVAFFDVQRNQATFEALPKAMIAPNNYQLVRDVVRFVTEGIARPHAFTFDEDRRLIALRQFLRLLVADAAGGAFVAAVARSLVPDGEPPSAQAPSAQPGTPDDPSGG